MKAKRVFLIVLDSLGAGEAPDARLFGDEGASTLRSLHETGKLNIPTLLKMGLGEVEGLSFLGKNDAPTAAVARLREASMGKDTTIGHWELAGHISPRPLPTFPEGFPAELIEKFSRAVGRGVLCNRPYSGTEVIRRFGAEHLRTGKLIVYTSADSVFQIAAHTDIVPLEELYSVCEIARELLTGDLGVGRVIARPFEGKKPDFVRTADRRDFSLAPPVRLLPEALRDAGRDCIAVGKITDIFAGVGMTRSLRTHSNEEGMALTAEVAREDFSGLCFLNLVDFDSKWGHRRDAAGYAEGLSVFDAWLSDLLPTLGEEDLLMITADHGCDPSFERSTDHTREYVPLLIWGSSVTPKNYGTRSTFSDVAATVARAHSVDFACDGSNILV